MQADDLRLLLLIALLVPGLALGLHRGSIPRHYVRFAVATGMAFQLWLHGAYGLLLGTGGLIAGVVCLAPFCVAGALDRNDLKVMALAGCLLGPTGTFFASILVLIAGAAVATSRYLVLWRHQNGDTQLATEGSATLNDESGPSALLPAGITVAMGAVPAALMTPGLMALLA
jgi:hypothetical protein